jgi:abortive infection bacteriophage resistance protein
MVILDEAQAKRVLSNWSYYRLILIAYWHILIENQKEDYLFIKEPSYEFCKGQNTYVKKKK